MIKLATSLAVTVGITLVVVPPAMADHCGSGLSEEVCVEGQGEGFDIGGTLEDEGKNIAPISTGGGSSPPPTETRYAPTCTGNSAADSGVLCGAAVETCPDEGEVRFWKWQRTYNQIRDEWGPWQLVDTVCLGPDEPAIDPAVAIPAIVQRDFKRVVVVKGSADVSPKPDTLVNVATRFRTDAPASYDIPMSILGQSVVITAKAEKYVWHFGDGMTATSYEVDGYVEHTYRQAVSRQAHVVITWSGSFTVNGGASQQIAGTATTTGDPVEVVVREARSELVRD
jgi:hypothetical protein